MRMKWRNNVWNPYNKRPSAWTVCCRQKFCCSVRSWRRENLALFAAVFIIRWGNRSMSNPCRKKNWTVPKNRLLRKWNNWRIRWMPVNWRWPVCPPWLRIIQYKVKISWKKLKPALPLFLLGRIYWSRERWNVMSSNSAGNGIPVCRSRPK